jgi:pyruvate,water dikinase
MTFCVRIGPEAPLERQDRQDRIGGKARSLVKLAAAGLRVPPAIAVTTDLFAALRASGPPLPPSVSAPDALTTLARAAQDLAARPWPPGFAETLAGELAALDDRPGARFVVRSSAGIEDRGDALGAGLFLSRLNLAAAEVPGALRAVLASALAPGVVAYLAERRLPIGALGFAALIHPFVAGDAAGTAALDSSHAAPIIEAHHGDAQAARAAIQQALARLVVAHGPSEIEWVATGTEVTFLQLRPFRRPNASRSGPRGEPGWRWDAAHNPLPLSPAQAGLVALVDARCDTGLRQKIVDGYLFYRRVAQQSPPPELLLRSPSLPMAALEHLTDERLRDAAASLDEALDDFVMIYRRIFGEVQPAARAAREALADLLRGHGIDAAARLPALLAGVPSAATARAELARAHARAPDATARARAQAAYLERFGDESPCWDVSEPTWREAPARLDRRLRAPNRADAGPPPEAWRTAADAIRAGLPAAERELWDRLLGAARQGAAAAETDDAIYARVQARVRRALLVEGARLAGVGVLRRADEIFWLPLETVSAVARGQEELTPAEATAMVDQARRADAAARAAPPSLANAAGDEDAPGTVRGRPGAGGARIGRVRIWTGDGDHDASDAGDEVIVARTILPTELPLIAAAALVVETGGTLDHVAAQARERGIPAVVGAAGACARFRDGDRVLVDGDAGVIVRLD